MLKELNKTELEQINGGHDGTAYELGKLAGAIAHHITIAALLIIL
jgi:bacteriocin-like protein